MSIIGKQYMGRVNLAGEAQEVDNSPTTVLTRDAVTGDVKLTPVSFFPSDADIDGLNLAVNQAAATLMLRNAANNVLSTVNLGFLNNEGTTFFYNSTTEELELRNDAGEVLSSIPVSAFVSNLIQSVNFNSGTPYRLEFKDASGDVVDFVDINVSNVQGAAVDADVLHKTGNETKTGNLSIIGDLGIANNRAIGVGDGLYLFYSSATQKTMLNRPSDDLNFMTFNAATGNVLVGSSTDTGEKLQVTGRVNIDLYDLPNSTPGVTIYTKAAPASPQALRVVNKDTNELLFFVSKNGLVSSRLFEVVEYIKTPKAIIRPVGEPDTGEALQVSGDGIISGGLEVVEDLTAGSVSSDIVMSGVAEASEPNTIGDAPTRLIRKDYFESFSALDSTTTTPQTAASLNSAHAGAPVGFRAVYSAIGDGMVYIKTTEAGEWIGTPTFKLTP